MFELIIHVICLWLYTTALEIDPKCEVDCACCLDKACGPGKWFDNQCLHGCIDGYFGHRCYRKRTNSNCKKCNNIDPACTECKDGYYLGPGNDCTSKCLPNCKTCTSGSSCTSCKEEYYNGKNSNDCRFRKCSENCICQHDQCVSCKNGFYNTSNSCNSLCPGNCVTCSSSTHCDSCKNGHYNGYQYDNKSLPLLNDCTHECLRSCLNCISFDSCSVCKTGLYGSICGKLCSAGCITGFCDMKTGNCNCSPNFVGDKCDRCKDGKYGDMCDKKCSRGCKVSLPNQSQNTGAIFLGTILALSVVGNIIFVTILIIRKCRHRKAEGGPVYENTDVELKCETVTDIMHTPWATQASNSNIMANSQNYEDLGSVKVSEHEYGHIRQPTGLN